MSKQLTLALAQLNPVVGDIAGNVARLMASWREAHRRGADLIMTSEAFLTGYCPDDFVLKPRIHKVLRESVEAIARDTASGPAILLGTPWLEDGRVYNAALLIEGGVIVAKTFKNDLPNYGPFDDKRLFAAGPLPSPMTWRGHKLGVMICEDMWTAEAAGELKKQGAELLLVLNGSPYQVGRQARRHEVAKDRVRETGLALVYLNQFGGQDELVYEGASFVMAPNGEIKAQARVWGEDMPFVTFSVYQEKLVPEPLPAVDVSEGEEYLYRALVTGLRDYVMKNGFDRVLLGLSGGIDSALVAAIAVDALGVDRVSTLMMPSPYTSPESLEDAQAVAKRLGCRYDEISIQPAMDAFDEMLAEQFIGCSPDVTEENIQARSRGVALMAISNKSGAMLLATGNKSELAVGYATLYGDMCGGYAPLKDVYKTEVYKLARWRNHHVPFLGLGPAGEVIPQRVLTKAPSAELSPGQKDEDSLPPYNILDDVLTCLIEQDLGVAETTMMGHDPQLIRRVYIMLEKSEYKRRQAPPGPKVTRRHLTKDRRYPITNRYHDKWRTQQTD